MERKSMTKLQPDHIQEIWTPLSSIVFVPRTEAQYDELVKVLNQLILHVGENEAHPLASLMDVVGLLIDQYENEHPDECLPDFARPTTEKVADQ
jgi:HTH-type transcriptional regulator / antitoxin HigA